MRNACDFLSSIHSPDAGCLIPAGDHIVSIRAERNCLNCVRMGHLSEFFSSLRLPNTRRALQTCPTIAHLIAASGDDKPAIRAEGDDVCSQLIREAADLRASLRVPDANGTIVAPRGCKPAFRTEGDRLDIGVMSHMGDLHARPDIPYARGSIITTCDQVPAIG